MHMHHHTARWPYPLPEINFTFPKELCCNCGTRDVITVLNQDTRLTRYLLFGGWEIVMDLPLPFCEKCAPSSKRRPPTVLSWLVIYGLGWVGALFAILVVGMFTQNSFVLDNGFALAAAAGLLPPLVCYGRRRAASNQSSYYQPVRLRRLRRELLSGKLTGIRVAFTSQQYRREFESANAELIRAKLLEAVDG